MSGWCGLLGPAARFVVGLYKPAYKQRLGGGPVEMRESPSFSGFGRVAELADAQDLKSCVPLGTCGFEPRPGY